MEGLLEYEKRHIEYLLNNAHEGTLFLKRNDKFPLSKPCKTVLVGSGARKTIKGGTGSGDVASRFFTNFETGLEEAGFEITSKDWLDQYDEFKKKSWNQFVKEASHLAWKNHIFPGVFTMGYFEEEKDYPFDVTAEGDLCVYVIARNSGEGNDRRNIKGDVQLSNREVNDILKLNEKFDKFLLVLNVGGVIDLSPVIDKVNNILYISQLGVVTGSILPKIILGEVNPSGKLTTTWAKPEDYPYSQEFGNLHDTYYKEGIYVGYRYFDSIKKIPLMAFGYGLSYTHFKIDNLLTSAHNSEITLKTKVTNKGKYSGKEVIQVYVSSPQGSFNKPYQVLASYAKTKLLPPNETEELEIKFDVTSLSSFNESNNTYVLEKGNYIIRVGNASNNTSKVGYFNIKDNVIISKVEKQIGSSGFEDLKIKIDDESIEGLPLIDVNLDHINSKIVNYKKDTYKDPFIETLTNKELMLLCLGHHKTSKGSVVGNSSVHVVGGAGETSLSIKGLKLSLTMADGPAGLRIKQAYGIDKKGVYDISVDPLMEKMFYFLPKFVSHFMKPPKNRHGEIHHQYTTAIPIGTSLAMSFNDEYLYNIGQLISEEMEIFNVNLWLAPALNIHRNILCGRNFEYYSEDPYVSGRVASFITKGIQSRDHRGVTIKHFCCNNQELNRNNNNSHVSERAFREIYLKGFENCIKEANPKAIMTSYNLLNGVHTSESYNLVNNILRCELNYQGLIMTDWITSGISWCFAHKYPAPYADNNIKAGNDLTMAGSRTDEKYILRGLRKGKITREDLINSASKIYRSISEINK